MKKIKIHRSKYSPTEKDIVCNFIQWVATNETIIAVVEDIETGQLYQFKLNQYIMSFEK